MALWLALGLRPAVGSSIAGPAYYWKNLVGHPGGPGNADGVGSRARFFHPGGLATDPEGNVYLTDIDNHTLRKVTPTGIVTTVVGSPGQPGAIDGIGPAARFNRPNSIARDTAGSLYVTDQANQTIRKVTLDGTVSTLAGSPGQFGNRDGASTNALFATPWGIAIDPHGTVYVSDSDNHTIRRITPEGIVSTLAGSPGVSGSDDGIGPAARFNHPYGLAADASGTLFVADAYNNTLRRISADGTVTTLAGTAGQFGSVDDIGPAARFFNPYGITVDPAGNLFVTDEGNHTLRRVAPDGAVTTLAGLAGQLGSVDGIDTNARFNSPYGVTTDRSGSVIVADTFNHTLRRITPSGAVTTLAGQPATFGRNNGPTNNALLNAPLAVAVDPFGNLYIADSGNRSIRRVSTTGTVTTIGGTTVIGDPTGIAVDPAGTVYVVDHGENLILKAVSGGTLSTFAGIFHGGGGHNDGPGNLATFTLPTGAALDAKGNLFVTDTANSTVRQVTSSGYVTTIAGAVLQSANVDGTGTAARFRNPNGIAVDQNGFLYVADYRAATIRRISNTGVVTTLAGSPGVLGSADGIGPNAQFKYPYGIAVDREGNSYVADSGNNTIRKIDSDGRVTTIGGSPGVIGGADGLGTDAQFSTPSGIAVDVYGNLYVADRANNRISIGIPLPLLHADRSDSYLTLSWSSTVTNIALQYRSHLDDTDSWQPLIPSIISDGTNSIVRIPATADGSFFRLIRN